MVGSVAEGIHHLGDPPQMHEFEEMYLNVRQAENRFLPDRQVLQLPNLTPGAPHYKEWTLRQVSTQRFLSYLGVQTSPGRILDLGCGNGWMSNQLATAQASQVVGLDINLEELNQAARLFNLNNLRICHGDIFQNIFPQDHFKYILLASTIQYFQDLHGLIKRLFFFLKPEGEIHILDSPLYSQQELQKARLRSQQYYRSIGFIGMANHYFHHSFSELEAFPWDFVFNPDSLKAKIRKVLRFPEPPFPWIRIKLAK